MSHTHSRSLSGQQPRDSTEQWGAEDFAYLRGAIADDPSDDATAGIQALNLRDTGRPQDGEAGEPSARPTSSHEVPPRISSARKHVPSPKERREIKGPSSPTVPKAPASPPRVVGHQTSRSLDVAPGDPSSLQPRQQPPPRDSSARKAKTNYYSTAPSLPQQPQTGSSSEREPPHAVAAESSTRPFLSRQTTVDREKAAEASSSLPSRNPEAAVLLSAAGNPPAKMTTVRNGPTSQTDERQVGPMPSTIPTRSVGPNQSSTKSQPVTLPEHVRLPEGFTLGNSTTTHVDTTWNPTITHHTIQKHRYEDLIQPVLKHHHIHHHYTYTQPVKVLEVLPAKHFRVDGKTGEKVEIEAPEGWTAPENIARPTNAGGAGTTFDGNLEPLERHYLVDEEHPRGQVEGPVIEQAGNPKEGRRGAAEERTGW